MRICSLVVVVLWFCGGPAFAGDKATAEATFQQGKSLMKAGKYAEACAAFEKSYALDVQLGTQYNLATCYEKLGRLASAWAEFRELAQRDANVARRRDAEKHARALQPRLIKLLITARGPASLKITRNGDDVSRSVGVESPIDPGEYAIAAVADGYLPWSVAITANQEGRTMQVTVPELEKRPEVVAPVPAPVAPPPARPIVVQRPPPPPRAASRKPLALIVGGSGLALAGGGLVFGALASSKWNSVERACGSDSSGGCTASGAAFTAAQRDQKSAKTYGNISTALVGVGAAALAAGVVLYVTSPSSPRAEQALRWIPTATPDGFAVTAAGRF